MKQFFWLCLCTVPLTVSLTILGVTLAHASPPPLTVAPPPQLPPAPSRIPNAASAPALLQPRPGLWHEVSTTSDGVTVTKIRDTTGGDYNVCYLATRQVPLSPYGLDTAPAMLAISCVPERRP